MHRIRAVACATILFSGLAASPASAGYDRAGYRTELSTLAHSVSGTVTIVDIDTIRVDNFHYDGGGISVYFVLGTSDTYAAFASGLVIGDDLLGTPYSGGSLVINLPPGETLDGYNAVSVWCVPAGANFGSGTFGAPYARTGWTATLSTLAHNVSGTVTIVDENTVRVDDFHYDGGGIAVYFVLGASNDYAGFSSGLVIGNNLLGTPYNGGTLTINLPGASTLDGYNAISVWCVPAGANFGSGSFLAVPEPPALVQCRSAKTHAGVGELTTVVPLTDTVTSEPRDGGPTRLLFDFCTEMAAADDTPDCSEVALSTGTCQGVSISGMTLTLDLDGVPPGQCLTATLSGIEDLDGNPMQGTDTVHIRSLPGDRNGDGVVNIVDLSMVKGDLFQPVDMMSCRSDLNLDGVVNIVDLNATKQNLFMTAVCP